jgi:SRSO17 transposase
VKTYQDRVVAAAASVDPAAWRGLFEAVLGRVADRFGRVEPRRRARLMVAGLVADLPRKNCWTLAEHAGEGSPDGMQHLLRAAVWDADAVRDDIRVMAREFLGRREAMLVVDETGDLKKGTTTVGVQRQYTGTAGRVENAQVGVFVTYATADGHTLIDREVYLPARWTADRRRCAAAGVPAGTVFATKPQLAARMIVRALDGGMGVGWVAGDEVYGADPALRAGLEARGVGYVLAVACDHRVDTGLRRVRADVLAAGLPGRAWRRLSAGQGAKGRRCYDWAQVAIIGADTAGVGGWRWLLVRRNRKSGELAYYRCYAPSPAPTHTLVRVAGRRWTVEENFQTSKGQTGLDQHQVRTWTSWYRWTTLVMLAHLFLAAATVIARSHPCPERLIALTLNEIRHLFVRLVLPAVLAAADPLAWSAWRRARQYQARQAHYQRQALHEP